MLITTTGRVEQRVIEVGADLLGDDGESTLSTLRTELNRATSGRTLTEAAGELAAVPERLDPALRDLVRPQEVRAASLRKIRTNDGAALLFNLLISSKPVTPEFFPATEDKLSDN